MHPLTEIIEDYIQQRAEAKLEKFDKTANKQRQSGVPEAELEIERQKEADKFLSHVWLSDAATRASQIKLVTHALKYTHTDAKGSSIYLSSDADTHRPSAYLSTSTLSKSAIDVVGNAAALDVAGLLKLEAENVSLWESLARNDASPLAPMAQSEEQLATWVSGFQQVFEDAEPASHKFAKQTYFPVNDGANSYHLLGSLFPTSMAQSLYERITHTRFNSEAVKEARAARNANLYSPHQVIDFPGLAVQGFGGTKPQNVSQLNSARRGRMFLLSSRPPVWEVQLQLPRGQYGFWRAYDRRAWKVSQRLGRFLEKVKDFNNIEIRDKRARYTEELIDLLIICGAEIRNAKQHSGWSVDSNISAAEQYWLDPYRDDEEFKIAREESDWQEEIARQFATWLNRQLKRHGLNVADAEHQKWSKESKAKLKAELEGIDE